MTNVYSLMWYPLYSQIRVLIIIQILDISIDKEMTLKLFLNKIDYLVESLSFPGFDNIRKFNPKLAAKNWLQSSLRMAPLKQAKNFFHIKVR